MKKERIIKIDGQPVPVTEEVYRAFKRPAWMERKRRQTRKKMERSLECFGDDGLDISTSQMPVEKLVEDKLLLDILRAALDELTADERGLVQSLYYKGMSEREIAQAAKLSQSTIHYHKTRLLAKLNKMIEKKR